MRNVFTDPRKDIADERIFSPEELFMGNPCCGIAKKNRKFPEIIGWNEIYNWIIYREYCLCGQHFLTYRSKNI